MTTKEFLIKSSYDDAGMSKFKKDCDSAMQAANELKLGLSSAAKIIDQNVSQSMNAAGERIRTVTSLISDQGRIAKVAFTDLSDGTRKVSGSFQTFSSFTGNLGLNFQKLVSRALLVVPVWEALRFGIRALEESFQASIQFMIEWQTQLAKIQLVTGASKETVDVLSGSLLNLAESLGISTKEVGDTANEWLRMGATLGDVVPLLEQTGKLSLISGKTMEESAKSINVLRSAFGMNAEEVGKSIDKLIGIQSASGVSLEVLLEGFDKASIKANQMGVSFDQLAGYIAAVNQKSRQTGEAIGTQLNMMFNRLGTNAVQLAQNLSSVPFYLDATGKATSTTTTQLRNTNDIIADLAKNWNNLSNTQQNALAKTLGSARQVTTFISLMENFNEAVKASGTSAGEANKDLGTVLGTVGNQVNQLKASWDRFSQSVSQTGIIQTVLNNIKIRVDLITTAIALTHAGWDRLFNRAEFDKKIKSFEDLKKAQKEASIAGKESGTPTPNTPKIVSSIGTEEEVKSNLAEIEARALLTRQDELKTIKEKLNVLGTGITLDGKDLSSQVQSLTVKKEQLEVAREISSLNENNTIIQAQMKADGASELQLAIQKLAYLQQIHATTEEISKQQTIVQTAGISEYKNIQDDILNTLISEQKTLGETNLQQIQNRISLEDQLGIHLQGVDLLKQQLDLYKAITEESKKTTQEKQKELQDLIKKTPAPEKTGFGTSFRNEHNEERLTQEALKKGISQDVIDAILHPNLKSGTGGVNSLQDELKKSLSDPLGSNIHNLANTISRLADAIEHPNVGPNLTSNQRYVAPGGPITVGQSTPNQPTTLSEAMKGKNVTVDLGGVNVTVNAHSKKELKDELTKNMQELISAHIIQPNSKMNKAIKDVIEKF